MTQTNDALSDKERQAAIEHSLSAYHECLQTIAHVIREGGSPSSASILMFLQDCADATLAAGNALARQSPNELAFTRLAAGIAARTAEACSTLDADDRLRVCYAAALRASMTLARISGLAPRDEKEDDLRDRIVEGSFPASDPPPGPAAV